MKISSSTTKRKPLITIITSVLNGEKFLEQSIQSVITQTAKNNIEYILIDGGSTDRTLEIIKKYDSQISYCMSEPDQGIYDAWNKGLKVAQGEWICFIGADDFFYSENTLEKVIPFLNKALPKFRVLYGKTHYISSENNEYIMAEGKPWAQKEFLQGISVIPPRSTFHHYSLFLEHGNFNPSLKIVGDYDFLIRELKQNPAYFVDLPTIQASFGGISLNDTKQVIKLKEMKIVRQNNRMAMTRHDLFLHIKVYTFLFLSSLIGQEYTAYLLDFYRKLVGKEPMWKHMIN